jgi:4-amino-4-deoxy-L-arabinose transferase-like glycosyltransferase
MANSIASLPPRGAERPKSSALSADVLVFCGIFGLVLFRLVCGLFDQTELSTDEAQYWFWGQTFELGAYSKPPLIGWIARLSTEALGQTVWAVRLPAALIHGMTAAVIYVVARRFASTEVAVLAAFSYLTLPAVALGSALMTTDTPMLLAAALALLAQAHAAEAHAEGRRAPRAAFALGLALGIGLLAKHAMLFWLAGGIAAAVVAPAWRIRLADAILAAAVFAIVIAPHVAWLFQHGFVTLFHVKAITEGETLSLLRPAQFIVEQFLVMGPILFAALFLALRDDRSGWATGLAALSLVPLVIVIVQAVRGAVLANWAVLYLVPGSVLAAIWLARHPVLAKISILLGLLVSLAVPLVKIFGTGLMRPDGRPVLARYLGHSETALWALDAARATGARSLVAQDRELLADLSWYGADTNIAIRAVPPQGKPRHHWEMSAPFDLTADAAPVLLFVRDGTTLPCPTAQKIARHVAGPGFVGNQVFALFRLPDPACLLRKEAES